MSSIHILLASKFEMEEPKLEEYESPKDGIICPEFQGLSWNIEMILINQKNWLQINIQEKEEKSTRTSKGDDPKTIIMY